jgi:hypothetical protein
MNWMLLSAILMLACLSGCTFTGKEAGSRKLSNTTVSNPGQSWWTEDGMLKSDYKLLAFAAYDRLNLEQDLARGHGEYLVSLGFMLGVQEEFRPPFEAAAQQRFEEIMPGDRVISLRPLRALVE